MSPRLPGMIISVARYSVMLAVLAVPTAGLSQNVQDDAVADRIEAIESWLTVEVDSFQARKFYRSVVEADLYGVTEGFYPYISCSLEDNSRMLFGYLKTESSDWLMTNGVTILIDGKRYQCHLDYAEKLKYRQSDAEWDGAGVVCTEELHIPARKGTARFAAFSAIAQAPESSTIKMRAVGTEGNRDWEMTLSERDAWRDVLFYYSHFGRRTK